MIYNVRKTDSPVTMYYGPNGVLPVRTLVYRAIKPISGFDPCKFGKVTYLGKRVFVAYVGGQWEAISPIAPIGRLLKVYAI